MESRAFIDVERLETLFRPLGYEENEKAEALLVVVSDTLRQKARELGKDLDLMSRDESYKSVLDSVVADIVGRALMTSTDSEPMTQFSQSALGYTVQGTYLSPGGGIFIKRDELAKLGLRRQRYGVINFYD
ncbi:MAG: phage Gp19/Gp15/Gp42 family protein [Finegoldia sp.]|nr:phage Gp19/Gp15/Gp42 family protein [Finegoldia sp.]